jgi:hypothetical protein
MTTPEQAYRVKTSTGSDETETVAQVIQLFPEQVIVNQEGGEITATADVTVQELYPRLASTAPLAIHKALDLLSDCERYATAALDQLRAGRVLDSDGEIEHLHAQLPEAFACSLGEGFKSIINAIQVALANRKQPLDEIQIVEIRDVIRRIQNAPYMSFNESTRLEDQLETANLDVGLESLNGLIGDESQDEG